MNAPERIWIADPEIHPDQNRNGFLSALPEKGAVHVREYINADALAADPIAVLGMDALIKAFVDAAPDLVWEKSEIRGWDGDYHTIPTKYSIRGTGDENYMLKFQGGFSHHNSPELAKAAANTHHREQLTKALGG